MEINKDMDDDLPDLKLIISVDQKDYTNIINIISASIYKKWDISEKNWNPPPNSHLTVLDKCHKLIYRIPKSNKLGNTTKLKIAVSSYGTTIDRYNT